ERVVVLRGAVAGHRDADVPALRRVGWRGHVVRERAGAGGRLAGAASTAATAAAGREQRAGGQSQTARPDALHQVAAIELRAVPEPAFDRVPITHYRSPSLTRSCRNANSGAATPGVGQLEWR